LSERSLGSYLLLPRPGDLVKAWIFPAAFALGVLAAGGVGGRELVRAAVVWLALELLIYQARYQWNDIRGFAADQRHPDRHARGRLPGPPSRGREHIGASRSVALTRLGVVAALALAPLDLFLPLLALTIAVFGVAYLYEALRTRATGRAEAVPPPASAGIVALWLAVGAGYAIRGVAGLSLAVDVFGRPWLLASAVVAFWAFGVAFVTGRWALEALAFACRDGDGRIRWQVEPGHAREHQLALNRWLPAAPVGRQRFSESKGLGDWRALRDGALALAPWNLAAVVAGAAAALSGRLLAGPADPSGALLAGAAGALWALAVLALSRRQALGLLAGGVALAVLFAGAGSPRPLLAALPWLCVLGAHLFFAGQSPRTLPHPVRSAVRAASLRVGRPRPSHLQRAMAPRPRS
jgi:hypothetical protein